MGKSVRSKIKKKHRAAQRVKLKPEDDIAKAMFSVRSGALDPAFAPGASKQFAAIILVQM